MEDIPLEYLPATSRTSFLCSIAIQQSPWLRRYLYRFRPRITGMCGRFFIYKVIQILQKLLSIRVKKPLLGINLNQALNQSGASYCSVIRGLLNLGAPFPF